MHYGVPCLCVPQMDEQVFTAHRMMELGAASAVIQRHEFSQDTLKAGLEKLLSDPAYRQNAQKLAEDMRSSGGCARAAQTVVDFVAKRV